jgi:hypothetical protein
VAEWRMKIRLKDLLTEDDSDEYAQRAAKEVAKRLRASAIKSMVGVDQYDFDDMADEFEYGVETCDDFNGVLDLMYNFADEHRIWIE